LPAHAGAFAMTVHKAQGSEFETVWLQLPKQFARTLSRVLVYTAITRARDALHVCASESVLREALSVRAQRVSGLSRRLRDA
jgi:exodeoxyribonuclease V alpha subunit